MSSIKAALGFVIGSLDPHQGATAGGVTVLSHIHEPPLRRNGASGAYGPGVLLQGARQFSTHGYVVDIDDRARFHDGAPVTAEDLAASINAMLHGRGQGSFLSAALDGLMEASVVAEGRVELLADIPAAMIDQRLSLVRVLPQSALDDETSTAGALLMGAGPYHLEASTRDTATLQPVSGLSLEDPERAAAPIDFMATPDADCRAQQLLSGDVHVVEEPSPAGLLKIAERPDLVSRWVPGMNMSWLLFNCSDPVMRDEQVRRALAMAIHREELADEGRRPGGRFVPSATLMPRGHRDHVPAPRDFSTVTGTPSRRPLDGLAIDLLVSSAGWVQTQAEVVVRQLAAAGITANVKVAHTAELFADEIPAGRFQVLLSSGDPSVFADDGEFILRWYLTGKWARFYCHLPEQEVLGNEALVTELARTENLTMRRNLVGQLQARAHRQCAMTVLGHRSQPTAWNTRLEGFRPSSTPGLNLRNVHLQGVK